MILGVESDNIPKADLQHFVICLKNAPTNRTLILYPVGVPTYVGINKNRSPMPMYKAHQ